MHIGWNQYSDAVAMPWKPLPSVAFAICTHPFTSTHPTDLPLQVGDNLYVIEQGGDSYEWFRGYLVAPPSLLAGLTSDRGQQLEHRVFSGIFPRNCVEVREYLGEGKTNGTANALRRDGQDDSNGQEESQLERRKSQARRLSRALTRKKSGHDVKRREREPLVDPSEPLPRNPDAPKPLAPVPLLRVGDEFGHSLDEPLVDEISSCLREWHDACLHEMLLSRGYSQLSRVQELIKRVDTSRKQLMHEVMTLRELTTLREDTVWDLVAGNKMMHDEVIVRSPTEKGRILTAEDSVIEMTKLQANMSVLDRPPKAPAELNMHYHVMIDVRNIVVDFDQPASLHMHLCVKEFGEKPRPISENFAIALPLPEAAGLTSEEQSRTLFINLNAADVGIGQDTTQVYAVFKLLRDEPVRQAAAISATSRGHQHQASTLSNAGGQQKFGSLKGRRSVFRSHSRTGSAATDRPGTATSEHFDGDENSSNSASSPPSRDLRTVKRIAGVGVFEIGRLIRQRSEVEKKVTMWTPVASPADDRSDESEDWNEVIRELQRSANGGYSRVALIKRFDVFTTAFAATDVDELVRTNPSLLHDIHLTEKLGFSGVPSQKRSDIYLTLAEPVVGRNSALQHSKFGNVPLAQRCQSGMANFQLTLEVRKANGERIEDCIYTSSNHLGHTAWRTVGVEVGEAWNQTIKLAIPAEDVPGSHIVMSIADSPNFPFALAWIPLWENGAFVRDGDHQVAMYVYDEYSSSIVGGKGAYLALPPWHDKNHEPSYGTSATLLVQTYLCSTQHSQDPNLLGLLSWRQFHGARLVELLEHFHSVPEIEIIKLLGEIFDALFEILNEYANSPIYEDVIFYNLVIIMTIAKDRRFGLTNVAETYAKTLHDWPYASQCLIRAFYRLITDPLHDESARKLRATLKVGDQMLRLIIQTKKQRHEVEDAETNGSADERHESFDQDLRRLFVALMALMRNPMAVLLGTQTLVVQHFHSWLPELAPVMSAGEILETATDLLDACSHAQGKMVLYRLVLIINYSNLDIFKHPDVRMTMIANTFRWLDPYWGETTAVTEQWRNQVRLCCSVVAAQMSELGDDCCQYIPKMAASYAALEKEPRKPKKTFSMLFPTAYPFPSKPTEQEIDVDEAMLEMSALLAAALLTQDRLYFDANQVDIPGVLLQALKVGQSILSGEAFPKSWMSLRVSHHRYAMTALERISEVLVETLPDAYGGDMAEAIEFDTDIWRAFFDTLFLAVGSPALAMETFPEQKRRAIWKIAGDVREMGASLLKRTWEAIGWETDQDSRKLFGFDKMGGYQVQFVPDLVAPVVELCLSVHASLRNVAIEVLRSMIISSWEIDQDLGVIQSAMIDCLDKLCRTRQVTESMLQKTFIDEMAAQFQPLQNTVEDSLYNAVIEMFARIEELLGMLANVHSRGAMNEATQIVDTLRLMEFLKDVQSEEAYIRYVHQLSDLQSSAGNHTEAGLALQMHADRYEWDPSTNVSELVEPKMPAQTAFERKEGLYFEMCSQLEKGQCWTRALAAYKQLAEQYETNTFDFSKLARSQRAMASIHERIAKGDRVSPRYFRVVYKGLGFPPSLRDKEYIFEAQPTDRQATFEERMQQLHPGVQMLRGGAEPDVEGQFLQVFPVSVNKDLTHKIYQRTKVSQAAREYGLMSDPQTFTSSSRQQAKDVPITEQVVEKVVYTTREPFPTLLRRSEVVRTESTELSPIQAAVERTTRKTQELLGLEKRIASGEDDGAGMDRLSEELLLSVDPDSASSVSRYRNLLPSSEITDTGSGEVDLEQLDGEKEAAPLDPIQNALKVALLDHVLAIRRCLGLFTASRHVATRNELLPRFEATYEHEIALLFPNKQELLEEPPRDQSTDERQQSQATDAQAGAGAQADGTDNEAQNPEPERRQSRRRSFQFLKRVGSAAGINTKADGHADGEVADGRSSRQSRQASRGRGRDQSLTRRLSFFRNEQQAQENAMGLSGSGAGGRAPSQQGQRKGSITAGVPGTGAGTGSLKKRFSFVRGGGMNSSGDYIS